MLLGRAHSNVFDGQRVMSDGDGDQTERAGVEQNVGEAGCDGVVLRGAPARGRVGFLTLFEAYKHVEVWVGGVKGIYACVHTVCDCVCSCWMMLWQG